MYNSNRHKKFLRIALIVFAISAVAAIIFLCKEKAYADSLIAKDSDTQYRVGVDANFTAVLFAVLGALGLELSFIRSVYKILKHEHEGGTKWCYVISAFITVFAVALYAVSIEIYLLAMAPLFLASFILGSVSIKDDYV